VIALLGIVALISFTGLCLLAAAVCIAAKAADAELNRMAQERHRAKVEAAVWN
jgi:hypothetical protein